jgi:hypothetical protein
MKYCFLILSALLIVSSCEKVEVPKSNEELLREGKWKMELDPSNGIRKSKPPMPNLVNTKQVDTLYTLVAFEGNGTPVANAMLNDSTYNVHIIQECQKDDYLVFREGITGSLNIGALACPQGQVAETDTRWGFLNNNTQMYIYDAGPMFLGNDDVMADVKEFSSDKFTIRYRVIDNTSDIPKRDTTYYTTTFKKF